MRILFFILILFSTHTLALSIHWTPLSSTTIEGNPVTVEGNSVIEFNNAGKGGVDWNATGIGPRGGLGLQELWLFDDSAANIPGTSVAETTFSLNSNSVGFVINGDHNDGFAQFFVDGIDVGIFDLHQVGRSVLVVNELDSIAHTLQIVQLGQHNSLSTKGDVAILGGVAFNTISEPSIVGLFLISFLSFLYFRQGTFNGFSLIKRFSPKYIIDLIGEKFPRIAECGRTRYVCYSQTAS